MATGLDIIKKSMRLIGALGQGEEPTAQEATDGLSALNSMLDSWSLERLNIYQILQETFTWASGQSSRTIGSGGNFSTTRPVRIEGGFTRISDTDYQFEMVTQEQYSRISDKTSTSSYPDYIYYEPEYPLGKLWAYPIPDSSISIYFNSWKQLQQFAGLTTALSLPPGYQRAIEFNLAIELQGEYPDLEIPPSVIKIATESKANIKRLNVPEILMSNGINTPYMSVDIFNG